MRDVDELLAAAQFRDLIARIAGRWGFDYNTGAPLEAKRHDDEQARNDVITLAAMAIDLARSRWPGADFSDFDIS